MVRKAIASQFGPGEFPVAFRDGRSPLSDSTSNTAWTWPLRSAPWGRSFLFLLVLIAYSAGLKTALLIIDMSGLEAVFFIPAGITVAFLIRLPRSLWWIVLTAALISEFIFDVTGGFSVSVSVGFGVANVIEPLVGASIVVAMCRGCDLARRRDLHWFTVGAVLAGPAVGAVIGATTHQLFGGGASLVTFAQWWLGDALGVVLVGGGILAWGSSPDRRSIFSRWGAALLVIVVGGTVIVILSSDLPIAFMMLIGIVLAGAGFGVRGVAATALAITGTIAVLVIIDPGVLLVGLTRSEALIVLKLQIGFFTFAGLLVAAESHERELATRQAVETIASKESAEREQRRQRKLALRLQRSLLPDQLVEHPQLAMSARYEAASDSLDVGGDWYDTFSLGDNRIGLVVGDIVGHGTRALISMGRLRTALSALAMREGDPGALLREVDGFAGGPDGTEFATVFYAIVDLDQQMVEYASAGHPPGLILRPSGETIWLDRAQSGPLSGEVSQERRHAVASFEPGATLILYSDGLIERRHESLDAGLERLKVMVSGFADRSPQSISEELFHRLGVGHGHRDDAVVLVVSATTGPFSKFHQIFPAELGELRNLRASVRSWAESWDFAPEMTDDILIAISEAAANSIRHAYEETDRGTVEIRIERCVDLVEVAVIDQGLWKGSPDSVGYPGLGRSLIESVTENFETELQEDGTVVTFEMPIRKSQSGPGTSGSGWSG